MKIMKNLLVILFSLLLYPACAQTSVLPNLVEVKKFSESVVKEFASKDFAKAFNLLKKYWPLPEEELADLEALTLKQTAIIEGRYGEVLSTEFISETNIKDFIHQETYVVRLEKHILRIQFVYYRGKDGWIINSFKWDDKMMELLKPQ
jgi:hypothetical protein